LFVEQLLSTFHFYCYMSITMIDLILLSLFIPSLICLIGFLVSFYLYVLEYDFSQITKSYIKKFVITLAIYSILGVYFLGWFL
jgi:hypothetical protein